MSSPRRDRTSHAADPRRLLDRAESPDERAMAALLARLPSPVPNDLAVARVWRRVVSPPVAPARRPALAWAVGAAGIALAVVLALVAGAVPFLTRSGAGAELALSSGGVFSTRATETWRPGRTGEILGEADRLRTDPTGRALVRVPGVSAVLVAGDSDVGFERLVHGTFLRLSRGALTARVSKRRPDEPFVVQTDRYSVKVVGTLFTVEQGPGDHTVVSVREGTVEVSDGSGRVERVVAGTRWTSDASSARGPDHTPDSVAVLLDRALQGSPSADLSRASEAGTLPAVSAAPTPSTPSAASVATAAPPTGSEARNAPVIHPPAPSPRVAAALAPSSAPSAPAPPPDAPDPASPVTALPAPPASIPPPAEASASYARGMELEAHGDFEGAARELTRAVDADPAHSDLALYSLGRLAQRKLHDTRRALAAFHRYREWYPRGALLPEVDFQILKLQVEARDAQAALAESARFLANHPASERASEVHLLRGNLLRDRDGCREALVEYAAVRDSALADDALYSTAYCQRRMGDRAAAAKTLAEYLRRFPHGAHRADAQKALESALESVNENEE